jgi:glycosyltransferase involved in cell wall biosynthesis
MQWSIAVVTPTQAIFPEGRCMSAMESLLVGTPVIAPDFGAFPYLVKHETNGLLYQPDSVSALTQAMAAIASDPDLMARLRIGAKQSGETLMCPERTFLQCLNEATR